LATIPSGYTCNTRKYKDQFRVNIYENGTTRHILVSFWPDSPGKWAVCFTDRYRLPVVQGLIPADVKYIEAFLDKALKNMN
jgi:hypothetical protein